MTTNPEDHTRESWQEMLDKARAEAKPNNLVGQHVAAEITPNVVISNSETRRWLGIVLYVLLFLIGTASLALAFFPEIEFGDDILARIIAFGTAFITYAASAFGLVVTTPNVPRNGS